MGGNSSFVYHSLVLNSFVQEVEDVDRKSGTTVLSTLQNNDKPNVREITTE